MQILNSEDELLALGKAVEAKFGNSKVLVLELSQRRVLVASRKHLRKGRRGRLAFDWRGETLSLRSEVLAAFPDASKGEGDFRAELGLVEEKNGGDREKLGELLANYRADVRSAQEANALGHRDANVIDGDLTLTSFSAAGRRRGVGFLIYQLDKDGWKRSASLLPEQPANGFTVTAGEDSLEIERLCEAYESGGAEAQELIREMAAISIRDGGHG